LCLFTRKLLLPFNAKFAQIVKSQISRSDHAPTAVAYSLIIGAQRGGTSTRYEYLVHHSCISGAYRKEAGYFDRHYHRELNWYRSRFPTVFQKRIAPTGPAPRSELAEFFRPHNEHRYAMAGKNFGWQIQ
jgi:hypothetical protein